MMGPTGHSLIFRKLDNVVTSPQVLVNVPFPQKTTVKSTMLEDELQRPVYRKDIYV